MPYHLPDDYERNSGDPLGIGWTEPCSFEVYQRATFIARDLGFSTIVDVGCGGLSHLSTFGHEFQIVGVDDDDVLSIVPPGWQFIPTNLDADDPLPEVPVPAVWVCANTIERLRFPERVVRALTKRLADGSVVVLATPDRERTRGHVHRGPSPNRSTIQEWTLSELTGWLAEEGWAIAGAEHIRTNDGTVATGACLVEAT